MKNYAKKYLSLFVAVLMAVTMLIPTAVFAEDNKVFKDDAVSVTVTPDSVTAGSKSVVKVTTVIKDAEHFDNKAQDAYTVTAPEGFTAKDAVSYDLESHTYTSSYELAENATAGVKPFTVAIKSNVSNGDNSSFETVTKTVNVTVVSSDASKTGGHFKADSAVYTTKGTNATNPAVVSSTNDPIDSLNGYAVSSADKDIASANIDDKGQLTITGGEKTGVTTITLKELAQNGKTSTCKVYNQANDNKFVVSSISLNPASYALETSGDKQTADLGVVVTAVDGSTIPADIAKDLVTVTSGDEKVFTVAGTKITAVSAGTSKVTVKYNKNDASYATATVTVTASKTNTPVTAIEIRDEKNNDAGEEVTAKKIGEQIKVIAAVKPYSATNKAVNWTSSNDAIASVAAAEDSNTDDDLYPATITVNGYGSATITATATDGSKVNDTIKVTLKGIELVKDSINANVGDEFPIPYTAYGVDDLVWNSNNSAVASVNEWTGKVTVNGYGVAVITGSYDNNNKKVEFTVYSKLNNGTAVYRVYNPNSGEHFYTTDKAEKDGLVKLGWNDEGIGWYGATEKDGVAVYRLYNANAGEHHYTTSASEKAMLVAAGWKDEGISFYAAKDKTSYPVYRNYNPNAFANNHNYSTNVAEYRTLLDAGWKDEGVAFYAVNPGTNG